MVAHGMATEFTPIIGEHKHLIGIFRIIMHTKRINHTEHTEVFKRFS